VDGRVAFAGRSQAGAIEVAPGRTVALGALLGVRLDGEHDAVVLYLSPTDYHRVHVPREGEAVAWRYVPGTLWPVFPAAVRRVDGLFAKNERMVVDVETSAGRLWVALVGAFGVGRIETVLSDTRSNTGAPARDVALDPPVPLARGADLGVFHLGSTVVLVAPPGRWAFEVAPGDVVRVGRRIGRMLE
jgi:phosphatidylserine decarboxylase